MQPVIAEGETEAEYHPYDAHHAHDYEALEHGGDDIFGADHAAVEKRQSRSHHQHEYRGCDHPCHVSVDVVVGEVEVAFAW